MNRRGSGHNQNQNNIRRSGKPFFVPGGQVYQKQLQSPQKGTQNQLSTAPVQQPSPKVLPAATASPLKQPDNVTKEAIIQSIQKPDPIEAEEIKEDIKTETEKKSWMNRKIPKKEKMRRRNLRLSKLLQPKNALMILHELVKNPVFDVSEANGQFQAVVTIAGNQHVGYGKSKNAARNAASETAIKYMLKHKNLGAIDESLDDSDEKMDTTESSETSEEISLPWQQVASFAIYKLFDSLGENPVQEDESKPKKVNSARKMPENPTSLNPVMVINQMYPNATFDEVQQVGNPPNVVFTIQCVIEGQSFEGTGPSKKAAKKQAAYAACHKLLGLVYPPEQYTPPSQ